MSYKIRIEKEVGEVLAKWKKSRPQMLKKFKKIYLELLDHPTTGTGQPEALKGRDGITYRDTLRHTIEFCTTFTKKRLSSLFLKLSATTTTNKDLSVRPLWSRTTMG